MLQKTAELKTYLFIAGKDQNVAVAKGRQESGRARGAILPSILLSLLAAILVGGCAAAYAPAPLPVNHPASPATSEAPPPPPSQAFTGESISPAPAEEAPAQSPRAGHGAMQGMQGMQGMHGGH